LTTNLEHGEMYLTYPKRVKSALENANIKEVACGDAHTIALT